MTVPSWRRNTFTVGLFSNKEVKASRGTKEVPEEKHIWNLGIFWRNSKVLL
jgi:hypothetical protein